MINGTIRPSIPTQRRLSSVPGPAVIHGISNPGTTPNLQITNELQGLLETLGRNVGVDIRVGSGGQPSSGAHRTGSHRHDVGRGAQNPSVPPMSLSAMRERGDLLDAHNPADLARLQEIAREAARLWLRPELPSATCTGTNAYGRRAYGCLGRCAMALWCSEADGSIAAVTRNNRASKRRCRYRPPGHLMHLLPLLGSLPPQEAPQPPDVPRRRPIFRPRPEGTERVRYSSDAARAQRHGNCK